MQQSSGANKRQSFMVDAKWQSSVATRLAVAAMVVVAVTQIVMIVFLASGDSAEDMNSGQWRLAAVLVSALQLVLLVGALWQTAIRITHSVAGPAWVIERAIDEMREGRFDSRLTLRDGDALASLAAAVQRLATHLKEQQQGPTSPSPVTPAAHEPHLVGAAPTLVTNSAESPRHGEVSLAGGRERARPGQDGFTLVDTMIASVLLMVGTLGAAMMGVYCSSLQLKIRDYSAAHLVACDVIERMRATPLNGVYEQYSADPVITVQERQVTVAFPQAIMNQIFAGTMDPAAARVAGFLPVRITVSSGQVNLVLSTFVGQS